MSRFQMRLLIGAMLTAALGMIILAAVYQEDNRTPNIRSIDTASGPDSQESDSSTSLRNQDLILTKYPFGGSGGACREKIGVDLETGYGATFVLNGEPIPAEILQVAQRPSTSYTFKPQDACPNGEYVRPTSNKLEICVYKLSDPSQACIFNDTHTFDAA